MILVRTYATLYSFLDILHVLHTYNPYPAGTKTKPLFRYLERLRCERTDPSMHHIILMTWFVRRRLYPKFFVWIHKNSAMHREEWIDPLVPLLFE